MLLRKKITCLVVLSLAYSSAFCAGIFPRGCEVTGYGYNDGDLILNESGNQAFYLVQNRADVTIELQRHELKEVFMSPPLQATLIPANWAAFGSDVANLHFKCYKQDENNTALVNCQDVLDVCQYPRAEFSLSNRGNYWVSANKAQAQVIKDATAKGIYLHW